MWFSGIVWVGDLMAGRVAELTVVQFVSPPFTGGTCFIRVAEYYGTG